MSLYLLLSSDTQLHTELDILLEAAPSAITLIRATGWEELIAYQESLQDIDGVLLDLETFDPPVESTSPLLLLGIPESSTPWPHLARPLPADTASQLAQLLPHRPDGADTSAYTQADMNLLIRHLRECVHDLNNQFTTLRGNLPLIETPNPEDKAAVIDMQNATEKANHLVHMLEGWFPDSRAESRIFSLDLLIDDFTHFANKIFSPGVQFSLSETQRKTTLSGDPALLCSAWLQLLPIFTYAALPLTIAFHAETSRDLSLRFIPSMSNLDQDDFQTRLKPWLQRCVNANMYCRVEATELICRLPKRLVF